MPEGDTALMTAARTGNVAGGAGAAQAQARTSTPRKSGKDRLRSCGPPPANNASAVEALIEAGADVHARTKYRAVPLLSDAAGSGAAPSATPTSPNSQDSTALHFAVRAGAIDAVKVLLKSGATVQRHARRTGRACS